MLPERCAGRDDQCNDFNSVTGRRKSGGRGSRVGAGGTAIRGVTECIVTLTQNRRGVTQATSKAKVSRHRQVPYLHRRPELRYTRRHTDTLAPKLGIPSPSLGYVHPHTNRVRLLSRRFVPSTGSPRSPYEEGVSHHPYKSSHLRFWSRPQTNQPALEFLQP